MGGGPFDGCEIQTDHPPRDGEITQAVGMLYKFDDHACRWVFQGYQHEAKRRQ